VISQSLVAALLTWIAQATHYAIPGTLPTVDLLPHAALETRFCHRSCPILGFTLPDGTILLDDRLHVGEDAAATSILVHELTHFLQRANSAAGMAVTCEVWVSREDEAYEMQYRWLRETSPNIRLLSQAMAELNNHPFVLKCPDKGAATGNAAQP
jgi:hypothetical protein